MMMHLDATAILFDMDGTLIDSSEASEITWQRWSAAHGVPIEHIRRVHHGRLPAETVSIVAPHLDAAAEGRAIYDSQEQMTDGIRSIAGAKAFFGSVPMNRAAIVTAATTRILQLRLGLVGIAPPAVCITAEHVTAGKPDPSGYREAARRLGVAPADCVVFEDAPAGLLAASRAGMRAVAILSTYTERELRSELPATAAPAAFCRDFTALAFDGRRISIAC